MLVVVTLLLPPALVALQVKVAPRVSLVTALALSSQPVLPVIALCASPIVQSMPTLPVYQPLLPFGDAGLKAYAMSGGVVSAMIVTL